MKPEKRIAELRGILQDHNYFFQKKVRKKLQSNYFFLKKVRKKLQ